MYKGKSFGTPFKKRGCGVRCLVAFEIRSGSYRVSPAKPGEKNFLRHIVAPTRCGVPATYCHIDNYLLDIAPPKGVRHLVAL